MFWGIFLNILITFVIPWIFGVILLLKDKKSVILFAPFMAVIAHTLNEIGFHLDLWSFGPIQVHDDLTLLGSNLGLYPVIGSYLAHFIGRFNRHPYIVIVTFGLLTALLDCVGLLLKVVFYKNGWNAFLSFLTALVAFLLVYLYYSINKKIGSL